jgi:hypothetical protein
METVGVLPHLESDKNVLHSANETHDECMERAMIDCLQRIVGWKERVRFHEERDRMNATRIARMLVPQRTDFRLCGKPAPEERASFWRINGHRAKLVIWTRDEWENMETPPSDAQFHPAGVWCALRID